MAEKPSVAPFTPGPWGFSNGRLLRVVERRGVQGVVIAGVHRIGRFLGTEEPGEAEANGRLISAAPELYDALRETVLQIEYLHDKFQQTGSGNAALARARAALQKAVPQTGAGDDATTPNTDSSPNQTSVTPPQPEPRT